MRPKSMKHLILIELHSYTLPLYILLFFYIHAIRLKRNRQEVANFSHIQVERLFIGPEKRAIDLIIRPQMPKLPV